MSKMVKCKKCNAEISSNAKVCPSCGEKNNQPIYKKWWFYVIIAVVIIAISSSGGEKDAKNGTTNENNSIVSSESVESTAVIEYTAYDVSELFDDLEANAMKAEEKYNNQYVEITGKLSVIDSDGKYISLSPSNDEFSFNSVQCYLKNDEQKAKIMELSTGDKVTLKGKITSVGEILGFSLNIDEIE